jgi:hypothetical protein
MKEMAPNLTTDIIVDAKCEKTCVNSVGLKIVNEVKFISKNVRPFLLSQCTVLVVNLRICDLFIEVRETCLLRLEHGVDGVVAAEKRIGFVEWFCAIMIFSYSVYEISYSRK